MAQERKKQNAERRKRARVKRVSRKAITANVQRFNVSSLKKMPRPRRVYLIDNDSVNFINCGNNIVKVKTPETSGVIKKEYLNQKFVKNADFTNAQNDLVQLLIRADIRNPGIFFDPASGMEKYENGKLNKLRYNPGDKIYIDFDRTITQSEGMLGTVSTVNGVFKQYINFGYTGNKNLDDMIAIYMGGNARWARIKRMIERMINSVGRSNVIILTNNPSVDLIKDFMRRMVGHSVMVISRKKLPLLFKKLTKCQIIEILNRNNSNRNKKNLLSIYNNFEERLRKLRELTG